MLVALTTTNIMQVSNMKPFDSNIKYPYQVEAITNFTFEALGGWESYHKY